MTTTIKAVHRLAARDLLHRAAAGHAIVPDDDFDARVDYIAVWLAAGHVVALRRCGTDVEMRTVDGVTLLDGEDVP